MPKLSEINQAIQAETDRVAAMGPAEREAYNQEVEALRRKARGDSMSLTDIMGLGETLQRAMDAVRPTMAVQDLIRAYPGETVSDVMRGGLSDYGLLEGMKSAMGAYQLPTIANTAADAIRLSQQAYKLPSFADTVLEDIRASQKAEAQRVLSEWKEGLFDKSWLRDIMHSPIPELSVFEDEEETTLDVEPLPSVIRDAKVTLSPEPEAFLVPTVHTNQSLFIDARISNLPVPVSQPGDGAIIISSLAKIIDQNDQEIADGKENQAYTRRFNRWIMFWTVLMVGLGIIGHYITVWVSIPK